MEEVKNILKDITLEIRNKLVYQKLKIIIDDDLLEKMIDHCRVRNRIMTVLQECIAIKEKMGQDYIEIHLKESFENIADSVVHKYNFYRATPPLPEDY